MTPAVTITMPAYNAAEYLDETIRSIREQTFGDWELVIADDCSCDDTRRIAEGHASADPRIRVVGTERQSGRCLEPRLLAAASGVAPLVCPVDADDRIDPDFLEKEMARRRDTGADIVLPVMWRWDGGDAFTDPLPAEGFDMKKIYSGREAALLTIGDWHIAFIASLMDRRKYLDAAASLPDAPGCTYLVEYFSRILLDSADTVAFTDARYLYRHNPSSVTNTPRASRHGYLQVDSLLRDFYDSRYGPASEGALKARVAEFHHLIDVIRIHRDSPEPSPQEHARAERLIAEAYRALDFEAIRPFVSRKYFAAMRPGLSAARLILSIYDRLKARK